METVLIKALQLVLALAILVIIHEFGHFTFARIFKIRVEKFYLFFNPWFELFKFKPKNSDTEYGIGWLPLGGYVKIAGMIDESMDKEQMSQPVQSWEFRARPAYQRLLVMVGGVLFNFLLAIAIYIAIAFTWGEDYISLRDAKAGMSYSEIAKEAGFKDGDIIWTVDGQEMKKLSVQHIAEAKTVEVMRNGELVRLDIPQDFMLRLIELQQPFATMNIPMVVASLDSTAGAANAGITIGDSIVAVNGASAIDYRIVMSALDQNRGKSLEISFYRNDSLLKMPVAISESGKIGIGLKNPADMFSWTTYNYSFFEAVPAGINKVSDRLTGYVSSLKYVFTKEGAKSMGGFIAIANIFPDRWNWLAFWELTAFLSIMLGVMNILPIPAFDGGHVLFLLYEVVTRRKPSDKFLEYAQTFGMILILALVIFANGNDIIKLFK